MRSLVLFAVAAGLFLGAIAGCSNSDPEPVKLDRKLFDGRPKTALPPGVKK